MYVQVKSAGGLTLVPVESRLMSTRKLLIEGEITSESAMAFVKNLLILNTENNSDLPIDVIINSPGGEIAAGLMMYDAIQTSKSPVRMFCLGRAFSMAAILFASGTHGRYLLPHAELMLHEPLVDCKLGGSSSSIRALSDSLIETKKKLNQLLARHTGKTEEEIAKASEYDHFFSAEESIDFGLADEIIGINKLMEV